MVHTNTAIHAHKSTSSHVPDHSVVLHGKVPITIPLGDIPRVTLVGSSHTVYYRAAFAKGQRTMCDNCKNRRGLESCVVAPFDVRMIAFLMQQHGLSGDRCATSPFDLGQLGASVHDVSDWVWAGNE